MQKLIAVVGPTSSGKSELAVKLAKQFNGEIISCDSRQVYQGMDLGTGKVSGKWHTPLLDGRKKVRHAYVYKNVIHHCIDFVSPKKNYSIGLFQKEAEKAINDICGRGKLPILCGGTGHWIDAVVLNQNLPEVKPNIKLRKELSKLSTEEMFEKLKLLDPERAAVIDWHNPRRLVRALEIIISTGKPVPKLSPEKIYETLWLGITWPQEELYKKIDKRLKERIKLGMIKEVARLKKQGLSWQKLEDFGLEYKFIAYYLQKKINRTEMINLLSTAIKQYSKRQLTWFKKNSDIHWIQSTQEAQELTQKFIFDI